MAMLLVDNLIEAIEGIDASIDPSDLYKQLKKEEDIEYERFFKTPIDDVFPGFLSEETVSYGLKGRHLLRNRGYCHSALLPAQSRYSGILTETNMTGMDNYYKGVEQLEADKKPAEDGQMRLTYVARDRQICPVPLMMDYKDFFYTTEKDGWTSVTVPNDSEYEAFGGADFKPDGIVLVCFVVCDWGRCPGGNFQFPEILDGQLKFQVNSQPVTNMTQIGNCALLRGANEAVWTADEKGRFTVKTLVAPTSKGPAYTRITSLVIL